MPPGYLTGPVLVPMARSGLPTTGANVSSPQPFPSGIPDVSDGSMSATS